MRRQFMLDECVSAKKDFDGKYFVQSVDVVGRGATDDEVFEVAKKTKTYHNYKRQTVCLTYDFE